MIRKFLFLCAATASLPLLSCSSQTHTASLEIGDTFYKEVYSVRGGKVSKKRIANGKVKCKSQSVLTNEELTAFWKAIEGEQVGKWLPFYLPAETTQRTATTSWCITLEIAGLKAQSSGGGAFPSDADLTKSVGPDFSGRFERVVKAFDSLGNPVN